MHTTHSLIARAFQLLFILNLCSSLSYSATNRYTIERSSGTTTSVPLIQGVAVSTEFFNPSSGQVCSLAFRTTIPGKLDVRVLDRDGFVVRSLRKGYQVSAGEQKIQWDGRDEVEGKVGDIVPDEAYSFRIDIQGDGEKYSYFPANSPGHSLKVPSARYNRYGAVLAFSLPAMARVHMQAGIATMNEKTRMPDGPVLRTILNRVPRVSGRIIEQWNGYDESGTIYLPDFPDFVVSTAAISLPENSIITGGNQNRTFAGWVAERKGSSLITNEPGLHHHHNGLTTLEDISPELTLIPTNAKWSDLDRAWVVDGDSLVLMGELKGPSALYFARQPGTLFVFEGKRLVQKQARPEGGQFRVTVPLRKLNGPLDFVAVNWSSDFGPCAVNSLRVRAHASSKEAHAK